MNRQLFFGCFAAWLTLLSAVARAGDMVEYDSKYYVIHSDLDPKFVKEAALRMTKMAEEYHRRTAGFSGEIRKKLPFYLFENEEDYLAAGGTPGSAGVFMGGSKDGKLMAIFGKRANSETWHVIQHEGFHQFVHQVINGSLPTWLDEGLAEYFGESIYTGDGFVTGVVPPFRLARLKQEMERKSLLKVETLLHVTPEQWSGRLRIENYDQAWSMAYFLINGESGKYQPALVSVLKQASSGTGFHDAWQNQFGTAAGFEDQWTKYWQDQPESPTSLLYAQATCATLTSFLARATAKKQVFADFHGFYQVADEGKLRISDDDWLPESLLESQLRQVRNEDDWTLVPGKGRDLPSLVYKRDDGTLLVGTFVLGRDNQVQSVNVDIDTVPACLAAAQTAETKSDKIKTRAVVAAMKDRPRSSATTEARKFLRA